MSSIKFNLHGDRLWLSLKSLEIPRSHALAWERKT